VTRILRCAACAGRIKPQHAHIGVEDLETGVECSYHARSGCQKRCAEETATRLEVASVNFCKLVAR